MALTFNISPGTLRRACNNYQALVDLYEEYGSDLIALCEVVQPIRSQMVANGYTADFSDREAELLYLLIRDIQPDVVVEISPCNGYSTNYILAALTDNQHGILHSYEISETVLGVSVPDVIQSHLNNRIDQDRFHLHIGDVRRTQVPACQVLFLDSAHESYLSAWFFENLIHNQPELVFVHDILMRPTPELWLTPKAAFLGIREQYYVLETLVENDTNLLAVSDFGHYLPQSWLDRLPQRYDTPYLDRSVIFPGHQQSTTASRMHTLQKQIHKAEYDLVAGDTYGCLKIAQTILSDTSNPLFSKLEALRLLGRLNYRDPNFSNLYADIPEFSYADLTVTQLACLLEISLLSRDAINMSTVVRKATESNIHRSVLDQLTFNYLQMHHPSKIGRLSRRVLHKLMGRSFI